MIFCMEQITTYHSYLTLDFLEGKDIRVNLRGQLQILPIDMKEQILKAKEKDLENLWERKNVKPAMAID